MKKEKEKLPFTTTEYQAALNCCIDGTCYKCPFDHIEHCLPLLRSFIDTLSCNDKENKKDVV